MKNSKFKKILISVATIAGAAMSGLMIWKKWSDNKRKNDADLHKDTYEGAGNPISDEKKTFYEKYLKRAIDIMVSLVGIIVLSPVFVVTAIAIYITDPGPVIFTQKRVGVNKTFFKLYKFRSMKMSTPHDVPTHMLDNPESYITSVGKFIRKTSIDELPQLFNILEGNLSVIGPRPALWNQEDLVKERDKYCANDVMPGLTGWAQINGRDELEIPVKAKLDGEYVDRLRKSSFSGIAMDIKCFFGTITSVLKSDGVVEGGTGELKKNSRYDIEDVDTTIGFGEDVTVDFSQMRKVLITGANSYIGESFEKYAKEHYNTNFKIDTIDMIDGSWREQDFSDYDTVFHVAGIAHADVGNVSDEVKDKYYAVNTDLAIETAKKAKQDGVKQFVFMSSMIIYGDSAPYGKQKMITAETKPEPANFYGDSKWQADKGVRVLADETFHVLVLRPPMIYGKGSKGNYPTLAKLAQKLPIFPDVNNQRSMLYIENLCEFLCQVMLVGKGGIFFPQNKEYTKTADMVKMISETAGKKIWVTKLLNPFVWIGSKMPGKIGGLVNKAFGNSCYSMEMSTVKEIEYQIVGIKDSICRMKKNNVLGEKINLTEQELDVYSVLMSIYKNDKPEYLKLAIESMLEQSVKPEQIVLVIDGPISNKLRNVISDYQDANQHIFTLVELKKNGGLGNALNEGIKVCRNELIARMDADDISKTSRCEIQLKYFREHRNMEILGTQIEEFIDTTDNVVSSRCVPCDYEDIIKFAKRRSPFNHPTVMYRKSIIKKLGGYMTYGRKEDLDLFIRAINEGVTVANLDETLLYYRTSDENLKRRKSWVNCKEYIQIMHNFYIRGYIGTVDMLYVLFGQIFMFAMPLRLVEIVSKRLLRKE